jgi:uncharacterized protein
MTKFILFVLVVAALIILIRSNARKKSRGPSPDPVIESSMTRCASCGVHFPLSEALTENGDHFCCEAHRKLGAGD